MSGTRRDQIRMTEIEVDQFLHSQWSLVLGTHGPAGWPHLVTLGYGFYQGVLAFTSFGKAQKITNLRRDPRLTVLVETNQDDYANIRGVQITGHATFVTDPGAAMAVARSVIEQSTSCRDADGPTSQEQAIMSAYERIETKRVVIGVVPERVLSWDHRRLDGRY